MDARKPAESTQHPDLQRSDFMQYEDYLLHCRPFPLPDGRYQAQVAIRYTGDQWPRSQVFLDLANFDSAQAATDHALSAGMHWVDAQGNSASTVATRL